RESDTIFIIIRLSIDFQAFLLICIKKHNILRLLLLIIYYFLLHLMANNQYMRVIAGIIAKIDTKGLAVI
ncbi:MAG: hypothetical protein WC925_03910, partial [Bacilli bacterium]